MPVHTRVAECAWNGGYICHSGVFFPDYVPFVELMHHVFICMPRGVTVGDSGLCCCVPCLHGGCYRLPLFLCFSEAMDFRGCFRKWSICLELGVISPELRTCKDPKIVTFEWWISVDSGNKLSLWDTFQLYKSLVVFIILSGWDKESASRLKKKKKILTFQARCLRNFSAFSTWSTRSTTEYGARVTSLWVHRNLVKNLTRDRKS